MDKKVYLIVIKEREILCSTFEAYDSFEKAEERIMRSVKNFPNRKAVKSKVMKNEFDIIDDENIYIHTLKIIDVWLR